MKSDTGLLYRYSKNIGNLFEIRQNIVNYEIHIQNAYPIATLNGHPTRALMITVHTAICKVVNITI